MITHDQEDMLQALEDLCHACVAFNKARAQVRLAEDMRRTADERWRAALATVEALRREITQEAVA